MYNHLYKYATAETADEQGGCHMQNLFFKSFLRRPDIRLGSRGVGKVQYVLCILFLVSSLQVFIYFATIAWPTDVLLDFGVYGVLSRYGSISFGYYHVCIMNWCGSCSVTLKTGRVGLNGIRVGLYSMQCEMWGKTKDGQQASARLSGTDQEKTVMNSYVREADSSIDDVVQRTRDGGNSSQSGNHRVCTA